jgi:hypothetical protein
MRPSSATTERTRPRRTVGAEWTCRLRRSG